MSDKIKVFIVDDHRMFRDGLKFILMQNKQIEIVAEASDGKEFLEKMEDVFPDIVLMDISMPGMDGVEASKQAMKLYPKLKIIVLSMFCEGEYYYKMINNGVKGFVLKESGANELFESIMSVYNGGNYFSKTLIQSVIENINSGKISTKTQNEVVLTKRESQVLQLICDGLTNTEIADKLFISVRTIEGHKAKLIHKTGAINTLGMIVYAIKNKLINI